jgi:hypothetical protein
MKRMRTRGYRHKQKNVASEFFAGGVGRDRIGGTYFAFPFRRARTARGVPAPTQEVVHDNIELP